MHLSAEGGDAQRKPERRNERLREWHRGASDSGRQLPEEDPEQPQAGGSKSPRENAGHTGQTYKFYRAGPKRP